MTAISPAPGQTRPGVRAAHAGTRPAGPELLDQVPFDQALVDQALVDQALVDQALRSGLQRLDPRSHFLCAYHLGFVDDQGRPDRAGGKGVRGRLALLSARATGAPVQVGLPAAVAVELVHNFSLLHDDLMDGDAIRRHRPAVWARFGTAEAILAGDAMLSLATELLAEAPGPTVCWALRCLSATTRRLIAGQTRDLAFEGRADVALDACAAMADDKTGSLLSCAASLGAVLADGPADLALALADYGTHLGLAFQLNDDLLGIWGNPQVTGKPVLADLRANKMSLPVVAALRSEKPAAARLAGRYPRPPDAPALDDDALYEVADLVEAAGGRAWVIEAAARELKTALGALHGHAIPGPVEAELVRLGHDLAGREC